MSPIEAELQRISKAEKRNVKSEQHVLPVISDIAMLQDLGIAFMNVSIDDSGKMIGMTIPENYDVHGTGLPALDNESKVIVTQVQIAVWDKRKYRVLSDIVDSDAGETHEEKTAQLIANGYQPIPSHPRIVIGYQSIFPDTVAEEPQEK